LGVAGAGAAVVVVGAAVVEEVVMVVGVCAAAADETTPNARKPSIARTTMNARRRQVLPIHRVAYHTPSVRVTDKAFESSIA
jgi:hypothetical protein